MQRNQNPFVASAEVYSDDIFFGRQDIINQVSDFVEESQNPLFIITGQRRIGKTSLLKRIENKLRKITDNVVYFTLQGENESPLYELATTVLSALSDYQNYEGIFDSEMNTEKICDIFLKQLKLEQIQPEKSVLLFDEFDVLLKAELSFFDNAISDNHKFVDFIEILAKKCKNQNFPLKIIIAIGRNYKELDNKRLGQLMKYSETAEIKYFDKETLQNLLQISAKDVKFEQESIDEIWNLTGGQPFLAQSIAFVAFETATKQEQNFVSQKIAKGVVNIVLRRFETGIVSVWDNFNKTDKLILSVISSIYEEEETITHENIVNYIKQKNYSLETSEINLSIERLLNNEYLIKNPDNSYQFKSVILHKWIFKKAIQ